MKRPNLRVATHARATQIAFEGRRAVGVHYRSRGHEQKARARREVILSGGPINSPQLLKLWGVGPERNCNLSGLTWSPIEPASAENLQDHLELTFQVASKQPITLFAHTGLFRRALMGAEWLMRGRALAPPIISKPPGFSLSRWHTLSGH